MGPGDEDLANRPVREFFCPSRQDDMQTALVPSTAAGNEAPS